MASGVEPFREHELSFELSTPDWLSLIGLKAAARYADVETDVVIQRVIDDESFGDALVTAGNRASETSDPEFRDILARLVAAALQDDTRIEAISFLLGLVAQLEPVHLRVLFAVSQLTQEYPTPPLATVVVHNRINADPGLTTASLQRLQSLGLVEDQDTGQTGPPGAAVRRRPDWAITELGRQLVELSCAVAHSADVDFLRQDN